MGNEGANLQQNDGPAEQSFSDSHQYCLLPELCFYKKNNLIYTTIYQIKHIYLLIYILY